MNASSAITVVGTYLGGEGATRSEPRTWISATLDGLLLDRHFGRTKQTGVRERFVQKGTDVLNLRQVSIVSEEELAEIAGALRLPDVTAEDLGANICLRGVARLTQLPAGTLLLFESGAVLFVTGENKPCTGLGEELQWRYLSRRRLAEKFVRAALGKRGLVAIVVKPGLIKTGSAVEIRTPNSHHAVP